MIIKKENGKGILIPITNEEDKAIDELIRKFSGGIIIENLVMIREMPITETGSTKDDH